MGIRRSPCHTDGGWTGRSRTWHWSSCPITLDHAERQASLPRHHRDPFDRLLVAQAHLEGVPIVSADSSFDACGVTRLW
ncbi:type II toxin-antitoxin system VapC family toxin [Aquisphaera giovannonii]|uniref:type II toxin-antitoxin system VapC family toxin n=1 Tax=Aquisphaera giovannonii TaxID=406548 RepID=UPI0036F3A06A